MAETGFTYEQVQQLIKTAVESAVLSANKLNPIEQRRFDEEMERERKRSQLMIQLGKIEEEATRRRRMGCTHMTYTMSAGKRAGEMAPLGAANAEWKTGGQAYQNGTASIVCLRCQTVWLFRPTPEYYNAIIQNGLLGEAPPPEKDTICIGCFELKHQCKCDEINARMRQEAVAAN